MFVDDGIPTDLIFTFEIHLTYPLHGLFERPTQDETIVVNWGLGEPPTSWWVSLVAHFLGG